MWSSPWSRWGRKRVTVGKAGGAVSTTGTPIAGELAKFSGPATITNGNLSGDVTTTNTLVATLAASGVSAATYGDGTHVPQIAVDAKGRITSASNVSITGGGTVTTTGTPASGNLAKFSGTASITNGDLSGDVTTSGALATTLASTAVTAGTYGSTTTVPQITVDAKGRITAASSLTPSGGSGGFGNITSTGAAGSEPGSPAAGDLYFPNNDFTVERYSGSAWAPWGPLYPLSAIPQSGWSWVNQGGASVILTVDSMFLQGTQDNGDNIRLYQRAVPSTPYTIDVMILPGRIEQNFTSVGIAWTDGTKISGIGYVCNSTAGLEASKFTNATTFSADYGTLFTWRPNGVLFLRLKDDGTTRTYAGSFEGKTWLTVSTATHADFLTPTGIGLFVNGHNNFWAPAATLISWNQH